MQKIESDPYSRLGHKVIWRTIEKENMNYVYIFELSFFDIVN